MADQQATEPIDPSPGTGSREAHPNRSNSLVLAVVAGVTGAVLIGGVGIALGATMSDNDGGRPAQQDVRNAVPQQGPPGTSSQGGVPGDGMSGGMPGGPMNELPGINPMGGTTLHGTFVIKDESGDTQSRLTQTGDVTAISANSISVRSTDSFTATYVISDNTQVGVGEPGGSDAVDGLRVGDPVQVIGERSNGDEIALFVMRSPAPTTSR